MATEVATWSVRVTGWNAGAAQAVGAVADVIAVPAPSRGDASLLVSLPQGARIASVADALVPAGAALKSSALVGSHATQYRVPASKI